MSDARAYFPLNEVADISRFPLGDVLDDVIVKHIWITGPSYDATAGEGIVGVFIDEEITFKIPGISLLELALGSMPGGVNVDVRASFQPQPKIGVELPLTLRIDAAMLRPLKANTNDPDLSKRWLDIALGTVRIGVDTNANFTLEVPRGIRVPRCMIGSSGVIVEIQALRWLTPDSDLTNIPGSIRSRMPNDFTGLYLEDVGVEVIGLPIKAGKLSLKYGFIGTAGFTGEIDWPATDLTWNGSEFEQGLSGELFGFKGALSKVKIEFRQSALTGCEIEGCIFVPYLDHVIGLSIGFDGNGAITAVAKTPICKFVVPPSGNTATPVHQDSAKAATAGPPGYIFAAETNVFKLDVSRIEFHAGGDTPASLSLSGRAKLKVEGFDLPAVVFKGLRIDTKGNVAVEGGWLDVDKAKAGSLKGFPVQITKIGFGAESDGRRWIGLNGGIKLADGLPIGASVEGLRVTWNPAKPLEKPDFSLKGIGLELKVPGTFTFAGTVAFFDDPQATGFRGTVKLELVTLKVKVDAGMVVGQSHDGTKFFFLFLDAELPAGVPLFSSGAAIYGFSGLLATNLKPSRLDGEDWYYGYYRRPPVGVTDPSKWTVQRDSFAIGLGTTVGSLPDAGFAFSAKVLLILALPGPQLLLQGKGKFLEKKPDSKDTKSEGTFEALLVLDVPAKLFQANLAAAFKIPLLVDITGGVSVAFTWADSPPPDLWHIYLGEKDPVERRIRAKLFNLLSGDAWLMVNRPGSLAGLNDKRLGEFEMGGALGINLKFDFAIVKAWLDASIIGQAAVSWDPQQFTGLLDLKGSAGVSVLGFTIVATLSAQVVAKAPDPWYLSIDIEVGIKIDLLLVKWEFHVKLPLEFGDKTQPLPKPLTEHVALSTDYAHADESQPLDRNRVVTVSPDMRPLLVFKRPVQDLARFGAPGRDDIPPDKFDTRQISYRLRHVVLVDIGNGGQRMVGAAGEVTLDANTATFAGFHSGGSAVLIDGLPNLAGAALTITRPGEAEPLGPFSVVDNGSNTATIAGNPPSGTYAYRLSASQANASIQITAVETSIAGEVILTIVGPLDKPNEYRGGNLVIESEKWLVLEATATTVRIRAGAQIPGSGSALLLGPSGPTIEGKWFPAGEPVTEAESSTRLQLWAKTPYAFFRHNEQAAIAGLDAFKPGYACGPVATEELLCNHFEDVPTGPLLGQFVTAGVSTTASGVVNALAIDTGSIKQLSLGRTGSGGGLGTLVFVFDPAVDAVWVTAIAAEAGTITALRDGSVTALYRLEHTRKKFECSGGVDRVEITGMLATVYELCFRPGWTCIRFEATSFPQGQKGEIVYAGVTFGSETKMRVDGDTLVVDSPVPFLHPVTTGSVTSPFVRIPALLQPSERKGASLTVVFPKPVTRVRVRLASDADVLAFAEQREVSRGHGSSVSLYAEPGGNSRLGWLDRVIITSFPQVRIHEICIDTGELGWQRYEQWKWSQSVQRSIDSLYSSDPVLPPGTYELRVYTGAVVLEADQTDSVEEEAKGTFIVGDPPGFPLATVPDTSEADKAKYPYSGPLTDLATYVERTLPPAGAKLWYRSYDTAVEFKASYITRMYLEAGHELRLFVVNASGVEVRSSARHVWGTVDTAFDTWTDLYVRTLHADGTTPCATVTVDKVSRPEQVTAGAGEPLEPARLHASELRTVGKTSRVVHRFEFTTSQYISFRHHFATFDGRCRWLPRHAAAVSSPVSPRHRADALSTKLADLSGAVSAARDAKTLASVGSPSEAVLNSEKSALAALVQVRQDLRAQWTSGFEEIVNATVSVLNGQLPKHLQLSVIEPTTVDAGVAVLLLESPEPISWERIIPKLAKGSAIPRRSVPTTFGPDFGGPDRGFEVLYGGLSWRAGVELWVVDGVLRSRADEPLDVTLTLDQAYAVELILQVDPGGQATVSTDPPLPDGAMVKDPTSTPVSISLTGPSGSQIRAVKISGRGVGIVSCMVTSHFVPVAPTGRLRIIKINLPSMNQPLEHEITLLALDNISDEEFTVQWIDAVNPGPSQLYASLGKLSLRAGDRIRLVPEQATSTEIESAQVRAGGPGVNPPTTGAVYQLFDGDGQLLHETSAVPMSSPSGPTLVAFPSPDGTRAFLVPPHGAQAISTGYWMLEFLFVGDAGPDLDRWSIGGKPIDEEASLSFMIV